MRNIHLGDVVEESDGDLMGDGVNIAARLEGVCQGLSAANAGLMVDPNSPWLHGARALAENSLGLFEQAKSDAQLAIRLSPRDPGIGIRLRPWKRSAKASAEARSLGSAGVSFSAGSVIRR